MEFYRNSNFRWWECRCSSGSSVYLKRNGVASIEECLVILANVCCLSAQNGSDSRLLSKEVKIKHIYKAIVNAKNIYPDALKKEIEKFKETFKDLLEDENVDLDDV